MKGHEQGWMDRDFVEASNRLVDTLLPQAESEQRVGALSALAAFAANVKHQAVHHITTEYEERS